MFAYLSAPKSGDHVPNAMFGRHSPRDVAYFGRWQGWAIVERSTFRIRTEHIGTLTYSYFVALRLVSEQFSLLPKARTTDA